MCGEVRSKLREIELDRLLAELWSEVPVVPDRLVLPVVDSLNALVNSAGVAFSLHLSQRFVLRLSAYSPVQCDCSAWRELLNVSASDRRFRLSEASQTS